MAQPEIDLLALSQLDASTPIPPSTLQPIFSQPPFVPIPGTFNTRDLGLLPNSPIRPGLIYRSGGFLSELGPEGRAALADRLKIRKIFDLRSAREYERQPDPEVEGVEVVWVRPEDGGTQLELDDFIEENGERGYANMYLGMLAVYAGSFRAVLEHVRDGRGEEAGLFHCQAGRDRTGVMAGLLLSLAGASPETITFDYMLSRIGFELAREQLLALVMKGFSAASVDAPGFQNLASLRPSCWEAFVKAVESEYGGFEGYVTGVLGFSDEDLAKIKRNLVLEN